MRDGVFIIHDMLLEFGLNPAAPCFQWRFVGSQVLTAIHFAPLMRRLHCVHFAKQCHVGPRVSNEMRLERVQQ
jgi:hypothetical protein